MVAISSPCLHGNIFNPLHHCPLLRILPAPKIFHNMRWVYSSLHDPSAVSYLLVYKEINEEAKARVYERASRQPRCFGNTPWSFQTSKWQWLLGIRSSVSVPFGRICCFISAGKVVTFPYQSTSLLLFDVFFFPLDKDQERRPLLHVAEQHWHREWKQGIAKFFQSFLFISALVCKFKTLLLMSQNQFWDFNLENKLWYSIVNSFLVNWNRVLFECAHHKSCCSQILWEFVRGFQSR